MPKFLITFICGVAIAGGSMVGAATLARHAVPPRLDAVLTAASTSTEPRGREDEQQADSLLVINGRVVRGERTEGITPDPASTPDGGPPGRERRTVEGGGIGSLRAIVRNTRGAAMHQLDRAVIARIAKPSRGADRRGKVYRVAVKRAISYYDRPAGSLALDVWYPRDRTDAAPTVVLVHGGGWRNSGRGEWDAQGWTRRLVHRGYVVVTPSYRMACSPDASRRAGREVDPSLCGYTLRESVVDVRRSLAWVRSNVADHGGDPSSVFVLGASAGGHLALMASADRGTFIKGVAAISPASDLTWFGNRPGATLYGAARQALGCEWSECSQRWRGFSPVTLATNAEQWPSTYVFDSSADTVTPAEQNDRLIRVLRRRGVDVTRRHPIETGRRCHGTFSCSQWPVGETGRSLLDDIDAWIREQAR